MGQGFFDVYVVELVFKEDTMRSHGLTANSVGFNYHRTFLKRANWTSTGITGGTSPRYEGRSRSR